MIDLPAQRPYHDLSKDYGAAGSSGVRFARREVPPRTAALSPTAERLALTERLHFRSTPELLEAS